MTSVIFSLLILIYDSENSNSSLTRTKEKEKQEINKDHTKAKEDLKVPTDFECFVCGTKFMTNEERKHHLEKSIHGHLCDTTLPQEQEEVRSSKDQ
jgi:hypothetical protein